VGNLRCAAQEASYPHDGGKMTDKIYARDIILNLQAADRILEVTKGACEKTEGTNLKDGTTIYNLVKKIKMSIRSIEKLKITAPY
jgi:hypothetical protein